MKTFTIELPDELAATYQDIATLNDLSMEEILQSILQRIIETHKKTFLNEFS
ncbi:MAG: hypothetical protein FWD16_01590 [Clostridia bacterium]|nr:hypothetical protein [Clostridia bacterium]